MAFQLDEAEFWLSASDQLASKQPEVGNALAGRLAGLRGMVALLRRDPRTGIALTRQALQSTPTTLTLQRGRLLMQLGMALLGQGDLPAACPTLIEARHVSEAAGDLGSIVVALVGLGLAQHLQGALRQSADTYREALDLAGRHGLAQIPFVGLAHTRLAEVLYEWDELNTADLHLQQALQQGERSANLRVLLDACQVLARLTLARGDLAASQRALDRAFVLVRDHHMPPETTDGLTARQVSLWLACGQQVAAAAWAESCGLSPNDELGVARAPVHRALVRVWLAQLALEPALRLTSRMRAALEAGGLVSGLVEVLALEAVAHSLAGNASEALAAVERAVALAEPEGYLRTFVDEGPPLRKLLLRLRSTPLPPTRQEYIERILAAFGQVLSTPARLDDPLRDREVEVLCLITEGYSNREIAARLVIGVSTVKTHINHLFQKLGVSSRTQAIARGRELGLLDR
jgi:LuxR family maltose regulon positive regulatory protein